MSKVKNIDEFNIKIICIGDEKTEDNFFKDIAEIFVKNNEKGKECKCSIN